MLLILPVVALPLAGAASPQRGFNLQVPGPNSSLPVPPLPPAIPPVSTYSPAPTPNRDIDGPSRGGTSGPSLSPSLLLRNDTYRGEGFNKGSTAQGEQEKRVRPGAGFNLRVPLTPN